MRKDDILRARALNREEAIQKFLNTINDRIGNWYQSEKEGTRMSGVKIKIPHIFECDVPQEITDELNDAGFKTSIDGSFLIIE